MKKEYDIKHTRSEPDGYDTDDEQLVPDSYFCGNALHNATQANDIGEMKSLITSGIDVNALGGTFGQAPAHIAAANGNCEALILLKQYGADLNKVDEFLGNTPLHYAAGSGKIDAAKWLVENGADINARDGENRTPLAVAVEVYRDPDTPEATKTDLKDTALLLLQKDALVDAPIRENVEALVGTRLVEALDITGQSCYRLGKFTQRVENSSPGRGQQM